jgi:colicin import membrane protein
MNTATLGRDPFMPRPPKGRGPALGLALFAHALLIGALAFGVNWRSTEPVTMAAELWSAVPQAAAPRAVEPTPTPTPPPEARKPEPVVKAAEPVVAPKPQAPALPDPQIAIEKAKREALKREKAERDEAELERQRTKDALVKKQATADKLKAEKDKTEKDKADRERAAKVDAVAKNEKTEKAEAAATAATREANLKRIQGLAGATGGPTDTGTAARSSGPSASYAGRIMARIKPNIVFSDTVDGNPLATVEVKLAPDGTIIAKRLVKSSGVKAWDEAVLRAIERTEILPRDTDGRVPPPFQIDFRLRD